VSHQDQEILEIAAWFHDAGFVKSAKGHELEGKILVEEWLRANDVGEARVQEIGSLILSTTIGHKAENQLEQIISDADLSHLGTDYYLELQNVLREEMEWVKGETINAKEWCRINVEFFNKHEYYTDTARKLFGETKRQNLEAIKDMARQMEEQDPTDGGVGNPEHHS
jgi:predicted metal-dependent HD superfamily phosphohydrolase